MSRFLTATLTLSVLAVPAFAANHKLTPQNTKIEFIGTKPDGKHTGGFAKFTGAIETTSADLAGGKIVVDIDTASLHSDNPKLTAHLKSPDFFNAKEHPKAKFTTTAIEAKKTAESTHTITGDLTLLGVTKSITFPATVTAAGSGIKLTSKFTINRKDFGMTFGEGKVDNPVTIVVSVNAK